MVPPVEPVSYYGRPVLNRPVWSARDIAGYLFTGGLAGASSVLAAGAELTGRPVLARSAKVTALGALSVSGGLLVHDLGRPERFYNMLRVFKPTSPMSVGSWILAGYSPFCGVAALTDVTGVLRGSGGPRRLPLRASGRRWPRTPASSSPTPRCRPGTRRYRELPFVFVGSAAMAASGVGLIAAPVSRDAARTQGCPARRRRRARGRPAARRATVWSREPYADGQGCPAAEALARTGGRRRRRVALLGGRNRRVAAVAGAASGRAHRRARRFGIFQAGLDSADDPQYTLQPQRERLNAVKDQP